MDSAADIIRRHLADDVPTLAAKDHWFEPFDKSFLLRQIQARQKAKSKLPSWYGNFDLLFPPPLSVEQCSSELTAQYKASLVSGDTLADLTGGMGIDSCAFARTFRQVLFVERQPGVAESARHNFQVLHLDNISVTCGDARDVLPNLSPADCYFLDPARRKDGQKVFLLQDCEPDVTQLAPQLFARLRGNPNGRILLKLSPMFDLSQLRRQLPELVSVHIVAVNDEVKELLAEIRPDFSEEPTRTCVNLGHHPHTMTFGWQNGAVSLASRVADYLYEPHPSVMKAGAMDELAKRLNLHKLHRNSHLYTSEKLEHDFFGRIFKVDKTFGMGKQELRAALSDVPKANITVRNFPMREADLRKRLKISDGGDITLFATTVAGDKHLLIQARRV